MYLIPSGETKILYEESRRMSTRVSIDALAVACLEMSIPVIVLLQQSRVQPHNIQYRFLLSSLSIQVSNVDYRFVDTHMYMYMYTCTSDVRLCGFIQYSNCIYINLI